MAIAEIEEKLKRLVDGCPTMPDFFLFESDVEKATKFMLVGVSEAFKARVEYYAAQSGFCRAWLDEAADETIAATLDVPSIRFRQYSRYRESLPSIARQLRKILQPRIEEWLNCIDRTHKQKGGILPGDVRRHPGIVERRTRIDRAYWRNLLSDFEKLQGHRFILIWSPRRLKCEGESLEDHHCVWSEFPDSSLKARLNALALRGARGLGYESEEDWYDQLGMSDFVRFEMTGSMVAERAGEMVETKWERMDVVKESITLCYKLDADVGSLEQPGTRVPSQTDEFSKGNAFELGIAVEDGEASNASRVHDRPHSEEEKLTKQFLKRLDETVSDRTSYWRESSDEAAFIAAHKENSAKSAELLAQQRRTDTAQRWPVLYRELERTIMRVWQVRAEDITVDHVGHALDVLARNSADGYIELDQQYCEGYGIDYSRLITLLRAPCTKVSDLSSGPKVPRKSMLPNLGSLPASTWSKVKAISAVLKTKLNQGEEKDRAICECLQRCFDVLVEDQIEHGCHLEFALLRQTIPDKVLESAVALQWLKPGWAPQNIAWGYREWFLSLLEGRIEYFEACDIG